jgi:hypothetical protein
LGKAIAIASLSVGDSVPFSKSRSPATANRIFSVNPVESVFSDPTAVQAGASEFTAMSVFKQVADRPSDCRDARTERFAPFGEFPWSLFQTGSIITFF